MDERTQPPLTPTAGASTMMEEIVAIIAAEKPHGGVADDVARPLGLGLDVRPSRSIWRIWWRAASVIDAGSAAASSLPSALATRLRRRFDRLGPATSRFRDRRRRLGAPPG